MKFKIAYFYPEELNLYGDDGNVQILKFRAEKRGFEVEVVEVGVSTQIDEKFFEDVNVVLMGGGPDSSQKEMYEDLLNNKGKLLKNYINSGGFGLYICGSYQLLGNSYKSSDGQVLQGLGAFDIQTIHFGNKKPRCIGNVVCKLNGEFWQDKSFETLVGFENHGGRTYLGKGMKPFAKVVMGHGNNSEDGGEGVWFKNSIGSYLHGPILARNPHLADYLIAQSSGKKDLEPLDDKFVIKAHTASKKLKQ